MNQKNWLTGEDPEPLLKYIRKKLSKRKARLFACACCRSIADLIPTPEALACIQTTEEHADNKADDAELEQAVNVSMTACARDRERRKAGGTPWTLADFQAVHAVSRAHRDYVPGAESGAASARGWEACDKRAAGGDTTFVAGDISFSSSIQAEVFRVAHAAECRKQSHLLRDIAGMPFRPVTLDPAWRASVVVNLAQAIYDDRAFERLPLLADALEDAGCHHEDILAHCRGPGPHVRGCWVVDLLLEKS